ncbi:hypothetical protein RJ641_026479, partial [Dillenia turbinata]
KEPRGEEASKEVVDIQADTGERAALYSRSLLFPLVMTSTSYERLASSNCVLFLSFQGWQFDNDRDDPSSTEGPSWFRRQDWSKGSKSRFNANWGPQQRGRRGFHFCEDDFEVETIFRSAFGGDRFFYWSFINEENPQWRNSSSNSNYGRTWSWRHCVEEDYDDASTEDETEPDLASDRRALGLKAYGPLRLEDVKTA